MAEDIKKAQRYLNAMFGGHKDWVHIDEDGFTGTVTMQAIIRAFQIQNGIPKITGTVGPTTAEAMINLPEIQKMDPNDESSINVCLIQCALFCKGYNAGGITGIYYTTGVTAVEVMQFDAGLPMTGVIDWKVWMGLLSLNWFTLSIKGDSKVRRIQRQLNSDWSHIIGVGPCDGVISRQTAYSLIGALQGAEGIVDKRIENLNAVNFGDATTANFPNSLKEGQNSEEFQQYNKLVQYALYLNGYDPERFDGIYDMTTTNQVAKFQQEYALKSLPFIVYGDVDISTMKALLISKGDTTRPAKACDCSTVLNFQQAKDIKDAGFTHVGRYLTGYVGPQHTPKALTPKEVQNIELLQLRVFPIYQDGGYFLDYFKNPERGNLDAKMAILAAERLGFPEGTTIYFAVDFDCYEFQMTKYIIPYFRDISLFFNGESNINKYKVGIYAPRYICTKVSEEGYTEYSFVADMSWGYSCNLGFPIPRNWAFDQFAEEVFPSSPSFNIDKVAYSGRDEGTRDFNKVEQTPEKKREFCLAKTEIARHKYIYNVLNPLKYWEKLISIGINYNQEIPIGTYWVGTARVDISATISLEVRDIAEADWNIDISLDQTGTLSAGCQNRIFEATQEIDLGELGNGQSFSDALKDIALSVKSGNITLGAVPMGEKQLKIFIIVSTDNLEPADEDVEQTISVELDFVITLSDGSSDKFDTEAFALATLKVLAGIAVAATICLVVIYGGVPLLNFLTAGGFLLFAG